MDRIVDFVLLYYWYCSYGLILHFRSQISGSVALRVIFITSTNSYAHYIVHIENLSQESKYNVAIVLYFPIHLYYDICEYYNYMTCSFYFQTIMITYDVILFQFLMIQHIILFLVRDRLPRSTQQFKSLLLVNVWQNNNMWWYTQLYIYSIFNINWCPNRFKSHLKCLQQFSNLSYAFQFLYYLVFPHLSCRTLYANISLFVLVHLLCIYMRYIHHICSTYVQSIINIFVFCVI